VPDGRQRPGAGADPVPRLGTLEQQVMEVLWDCPQELCTREVLTGLAATSPAYTTIATVLTNLARKGMVERVMMGRVWGYRPLHSRAAYAAGRMTEALDAAGDRTESLRHFVHGMSADDTALLRSLLDAPDDAPRSTPSAAEAEHCG
jgi:predicted transcriptional regulator